MIYLVTVKRVLEETYTVELEADSVKEARESAVEGALDDPPQHWRYRPITYAKALKVERL